MALRLSGGDLLGLLDVGELLAHLERGFRDYVSGGVINPLRVSLRSGGDWWGVMPSYSPGLGFCVKAVSVIPSNASRGLPTTRAVTMLFDADNGGVKAIMDGTVLTGIRTACATALFFKHNHPPVDVFFYGAGLQARYHARILSSVFRLGRVNAQSRSGQSAEAFLRECEGLGLRVDRSLRVEGADTVVAATTSTTPVVKGFAGRNRVIVSVGAPTPDARELADEVLAASELVVVDTEEGCLNEAGDIVQTLSSGVLDRERIVELGRIIESGKPVGHGRVVYKSVGSAFMDLYASEYFYRKASELGVGERFEV